MQAKKLLYELKQSPNQWYKHFSFIRGKRYTRSYYKLYMYYNKSPDGDLSTITCERYAHHFQEQIYN